MRAGALPRAGQADDHRRALLRPADADRKLHAAAVLLLQSRSAEAGIRSGQGKEAAGRRRLGRLAGTASASKDGVRLAFTNSTTAGNHIREQAQQFIQQSFKDIGVEMSDLQPAAGRDVGRLLDEVAVRQRHRRHRLPDRPRSRHLRLLQLDVDSGAKGGAGQNTWQYASPEVDKLLQEGGQSLRAGRAQEDLPENPGDRAQRPAIPADVPVRDGPRAQEGSSRASTPNVNVRIDTWNVATWYWNA